jgi:hypothetical protein
MGNLNHKSSFDTCFYAFIKHLVKDHNYKLLKYKATLENYEKILHLNNINKTIIRYGDLYMFKLDHEEQNSIPLNNCLLEPFLRQLTFESDKKSTLLTDYVLNEFRQRHKQKMDIFVIGFSQINWCKAVAFAFVKYFTNPISDKEEPELSVLVSNKLYSYGEELKVSQNLFNWSKEDYDTKCDNVDEKINKDNYDKCRQIKTEAESKTRIGLGMFTLLSVLKFLKTFNYEYIRLECDPSLYSYYRKLGFELGPNPMVHTKYKVYNVDIEKNPEYIKTLYKRENIQYIVDEFKVSSEEQVYQFVSPINDIGSTIYMHKKFDSRTIKNIVELLLKYKPNIYHILNSKIVFDTMANMDTLTNAIKATQCISAYLDNTNQQDLYDERNYD